MCIRKTKKAVKEVEDLKHKIREQLGNYIYSEGCECCQDIDEHRKARNKLAKLLDIEKNDDGSGYDFYKYKT